MLEAPPRSLALYIAQIVHLIALHSVCGPNPLINVMMIAVMSRVAVQETRRDPVKDAVASKVLMHATGEAVAIGL